MIPTTSSWAGSKAPAAKARRRRDIEMPSPWRSAPGDSNRARPTSRAVAAMPPPQTPDACRAIRVAAALGSNPAANLGMRAAQFNLRRREFNRAQRLEIPCAQHREQLQQLADPLPLAALVHRVPINPRKRPRLAALEDRAHPNHPIRPLGMNQM